MISNAKSLQNANDTSVTVSCAAVRLCHQCRGQYALGLYRRRDHRRARSLRYTDGDGHIPSRDRRYREDKRYVFVGNEGSNDISAFAVNITTGALTAVPGSPFAAGTDPQAHGLSMDRTLYVANAGL